MHLLGARYELEGVGDMGETFFLCGLGEALVEVAPLFALACGGFGEVGLGVAAKRV